MLPFTSEMAGSRTVAVVGAGHTPFGSLGPGEKVLFAEDAFEAFVSVERDFEPSVIRGA